MPKVCPVSPQGHQQQRFVIAATKPAVCRPPESGRGVGSSSFAGTPWSIRTDSTTDQYDIDTKGLWSPDEMCHGGLKWQSNWLDCSLTAHRLLLDNGASQPTKPDAFVKFEEYRQLDGLALAELVRSGQVSAEELLDTAWARLEAVNPKLNFLVTPSGTGSAANQAAFVWPLCGSAFPDQGLVSGHRRCAQLQQLSGLASGWSCGFANRHHHASGG